MATKSLIVLKKVVVPDQEEDGMLDVLEDGHVEGGTEEQGNQLIHRFDATEKQKQLHPCNITFEVFFCIYEIFIVQCPCNG